ncbi:hypothetical protein EVAR_39040_1 [Eumeta japonica]|uniref:Uncharacterized protein n=1 Tax=Eumeta variegata TaxID=151549 RepID=A0A4C1WN20_EUMVA|nr:hypothetical protein EVAR_39040_1 [Eumeta japonica]
MRRKGVIIKKLLLSAIFSIWRRERQPYEVAKLKFGKSISKSIKLPIFKTPGKLSRERDGTTPATAGAGRASVIGAAAASTGRPDIALLEGFTGLFARRHFKRSALLSVRMQCNCAGNLPATAAGGYLNDDSRVCLRRGMRVVFFESDLV